MFGYDKRAVLRYGTPEFEVLRPGDHVECAVTGKRIPLDELRYWSVQYQEAYFGAAESTEAHLAGGASNLAKQ